MSPPHSQSNLSAEAFEKMVAHFHAFQEAVLPPFPASNSQSSDIPLERLPAKDLSPLFASSIQPQLQLQQRNSSTCNLAQWKISPSAHHSIIYSANSKDNPILVGDSPTLSPEEERTPLPSKHHIEVLSTSFFKWPVEKAISVAYYQSLIYKSLFQLKSRLSSPTDLKDIAIYISMHPLLKHSDAEQIHLFLEKAFQKYADLHGLSPTLLDLSHLFKALENLIVEKVDPAFKEEMQQLLKAILQEEQQYIYLRRIKNLWDESSPQRRPFATYVRRILKEADPGCSMHSLLQTGALYEKLSCALQELL
ncbi:MAG: hypothetical protein K0S07_62 [Chlamydiales bacterium]|jgi:hypothetical protein|nr:hypothetical protein [Chlamydiales bacterium]